MTSFSHQSPIKITLFDGQAGRQVKFNTTLWLPRDFRGPALIYVCLDLAGYLNVLIGARFINKNAHRRQGTPNNHPPQNLRQPEAESGFESEIPYSAKVASRVEVRKIRIISDLGQIVLFCFWVFQAAACPGLKVTIFFFQQVQWGYWGKIIYKL